jgi:KUP system potassium uptake protein
MGHFGRSAIRIDWFAIVMPALMLNYLGQGALVLFEPTAAHNPFFLLFPPWALIPVVVVTTAATIIASQAVISGAFALVQQAIQLGALPRLDVRQTSDEQIGQVYVPQINWLLAAAVVGLVLGFRSSDALANAYGIAVAGDMLVTTLLVAVVAFGVWGWPWLAVLLVVGFFLALDLTFVSANVHKIPAGGWFPLVVGGLSLTLMLSWVRGRAVAFERREQGALSIAEFLKSMTSLRRVPGVAIYLTTRRDVVPSALTLNLKHNRVLHELVVILKIITERSPRLAEEKRVLVEKLSIGLLHITIRFGFAEKPDVLAALSAHVDQVGFVASDASFFLGREVPVPSLRPEVPVWQEHLYAFMTRNAVRAPDYFLIPPAQVVELGTKVEL